MYALIQNGTITQVAAGPPSKAQEVARDYTRGVPLYRLDRP